MDDGCFNGLCCDLDVYTCVKIMIDIMKNSTLQQNPVTNRENIQSNDSDDKKKKSIASLLAMDEGSEIEFETVRPKDFGRPIEF